MFCKKCGAQLPNETVICPSCGTAAEPIPPQPYPSQSYRPYVQPNPFDTGSVGWWFLGFFFPLVGLILFLVWRNDKPLSAKRAGWGALVGLIVWFILSSLTSMFLFALFVELVEAMTQDGWFDSEFMKILL